jgi:hypothetical protein
VAALAVEAGVDVDAAAKHQAGDGGQLLRRRRIYLWVGLEAQDSSAGER